ncbi:hypothetical protein EYZ11_002798 [Aspergillus tanneri]|uniref:DNL-type domain-containing protein n=1 Tax=Aspergillus tanneri TaxID=1220188 RepID=A0A4S3JTZ7_9EURO|nr:uncharacterized protein ATNIH1004_008594 [Aspergillus tanneri]KAA8644390.1 hypothetical protein ATNIH1004_008594 [Aspergillus tanneri]THC97751.1 hypothetical protein EYZ11_002798 [Aspergillus tanneri]
MRSSMSLFQGLHALQYSLPRMAISHPASRSFSQLAHRSRRPSLASSWIPRGVSLSTSTIRYAKSPLTDRTSDDATDAELEEQNRKRRQEEPAYQITFTCKPCGHRSSHRMSKHGYHRGTVLIRCPSCLNRHVISDHLNIFFDEKKKLEDILAKQGDKVTRGYVDGDMEFWDDGTAYKKTGDEAKSD